MLYNWLMLPQDHALSSEIIMEILLLAFISIHIRIDVFGV